MAFSEQIIYTALMTLELTKQQQAVIQQALNIGLYETEEDLLEDGLKNARAKSAAWLAEMKRRDVEDERIPAEQVYAELREHLNSMFSSSSEE